MLRRLALSGHARRYCSAARRYCSTAQLLPSRQGLTLCLDLDETLISCRADDADFETLTFMEPGGAEQVRAAEEHEFLHKSVHERIMRPRLPIDAEIELPYLEAPLQLRKRPLLDDFLREAGKLAELVIFTAAAQSYAELALNEIDPTGEIFEGRLYYRDHCTEVDGMILKDVAKVGRPMDRILLVDDNVSSSFITPDSILPIRPFAGDPDDRALADLLPTIRALSAAPNRDVRTYLRDNFSLTANLLQHIREAKKDYAEGPLAAQLAEEKRNRQD